MLVGQVRWRTAAAFAGAASTSNIASRPRGSRSTTAAC